MFVLSVKVYLTVSLVSTETVKQSTTCIAVLGNDIIILGGVIMHSPQVYYDLEALGLLKRDPAAWDEKSKFAGMSTADLPPDVFWEEQKGEYTYWRYDELPDESIYMQLATMNAKNIRTIKRVAIFFAVVSILSVISFIIGFFAGLAR